MRALGLGLCALLLTCTRSIQAKEAATKTGNSYDQFVRELAQFESFLRAFYQALYHKARPAPFLLFTHGSRLKSTWRMRGRRACCQQRRSRWG